MNEHNKDYVLPVSIVGRADLNQLSREIEVLEDSLQAEKVRSGKSPQDHNFSRKMRDFLEQNKLELSDAAKLDMLKKHLRAIIEHAPAAHMTFASEIDQKALEKLVGWFRSEVHPYALVSVGMQPSLVGGVYLRTPNQVHDFTVKALLNDKRDVVLQELEALKK